MPRDCHLRESNLVEAIHQAMIGAGKTLALAESCTGGAIAARLVARPGASLFFLGSVVAYANDWKEHFLKVSRDTLEKKGAVSREVVLEMAQGLLAETSADYVIAVSGILGPPVERAACCNPSSSGEGQASRLPGCSKELTASYQSGDSALFERGVLQKNSKPIGTVFLAIGQKGGSIDVDQVDALNCRQEGIEIVVQAAFSFLWKRLLQNGVIKS